MNPGAIVESMPTSPAADPVTIAPSQGAHSPIRHLLLTAIPPAVIVTVLLWFVIGWLAPIIGIAVGLGLSWVLARQADDMVFALAGGTVANPDRDARLVNVVEGLSLTAGIGVPEIRVREDHTVNAMAAGRMGGDTAVIVTRGLLDRVDRIELEGVIAHLLIRLRSAEQEQRTLAVTTTALPRFLAERFAGARGPGPNDPSLETRLLTDREAVQLTRYPPGLLRALEQAIEAGTEISDAGPATSAFWLAPVDGDTDGLTVRVDALREL